jgi:hypothetical protein
MKSAGSIVVTYIDPFNEFASVAHLLLKILSSLEWLSDVPVVGDAPHQLSDSIGLWEESTRVDDAFLCLFIGRSADDAECVSWVQQARRRNAGFLILTLSGGISGSVGTIPKATSQWNGLASALWRRARSQPSLSDDLLPVEGVGIFLSFVFSFLLIFFCPKILPMLFRYIPRIRGPIATVLHFAIVRPKLCQRQLPVSLRLGFDVVFLLAR